MPAQAEAPELTVVMPCLDEAETIGACIGKARTALEAHGIAAEILVADNGSTDGSQAVARREGARVVPIAQRGYGSALMGGIRAARGRYILMGDADDSYDFGQAPLFVEKLRQGFDLVQGCRLETGGGRVLPGAMPASHRLIGNPLFSKLVRWWYRAPVNDVYCGMRAFTRDHYERLGQRCTGMEFATEMIVKSSICGARIAEVPVTLHPDGRTAHTPHLRTMRDGWRTLRFLLLYSPRWLFLVPGLALCLAGAVGYALALPAVHALGVTFDAHTLLFSTLAIMCGYQSVLFAVMTREFAASEGLLPRNPRLDRAMTILSLERVLAIAGVVMIAGIVLLVLVVNDWRLRHFGHLDYPHTMRMVVPGVLLVALGFQTILFGFFLSILGLRRM
ncbi:MAG: glycosyltransferase family 2 protein [Solirubrobacterales bacterium]|nr:glycosyltransferase family 2 protein [Solirubrobacterales bacterium]MBV9473723.1 glycosyltransferase family 2 protein [Solirubrobacterales bacterium]MBV9838056.1 glycosyltransferase family 2 protein [Solirubrobacterales bacterium]